MNLHAIVRGMITAVNPDVTVTMRVSTGYTKLPSSKQVPTYDDVPGIVCQTQPLTYQDLMKLDGLNIQGIRRVIYTNGFYGGIIRDKSRGGDLIVFPAGYCPEGDTWLLVQELEPWPDWIKFALTLQNGA